MRYSAKVDRNQSEIVFTLRSLGATVQHLHSVGEGCPDLLIGYHGINLLMEIKDGDKSPSRRCLTPAQKKWHSTWKGSIFIVESINDAINILNNVFP